MTLIKLLSLQEITIEAKDVRTCSEQPARTGYVMGVGIAYFSRLERWRESVVSSAESEGDQIHVEFTVVQRQHCAYQEYVKFMKKS